MANALVGETSPYLRQHASNPVEWYPWGPEALEKAQRENKPILLSIGYSACHWCHVMAHESFEDDATARLMNEQFVNIKVDREERPDLDRVYQLAHQILTQRAGGWPLTMFLTPREQNPFFAGTYFPRMPRLGMPSFTQVLAHVATAYSERTDDIERQNNAMLEALRRLSRHTADDAVQMTSAPIEAASAQLLREFDHRHGGFGEAPKFPQPTNLDFLMRCFASSSAAGRPDNPALHAAAFTLTKMAHGGIYDQLAGGFCRYSVDRYWMIPHFEKMLYDNGLLLGLYAQAWQLTGEALFELVTIETGGWAVREMQSPQGGYYSTLDADSEGHEGKFYVWTPEEVSGLLSQDEYAVVAKRFGLDGPANFEDDYWHLHVCRDGEELIDALGKDPATMGRLLASARETLREVRSRRVWPDRDEKVQASWNALMIKGMATAGRILGVERFTQSAERSLDFVRTTLWRDGRLLATSRDGRACLPAYLDDHAFLIDALLALLQTRWCKEDMEFAVELAEVMLEQFQDQEGGGFYFTANDHERLIHRPKPMTDEAIPSGNGVAARALARLGHLLGGLRYLEAAERTIRAGWSSLVQFPQAHTTMLTALEEYLHPTQTIVLRGRGAEFDRWQQRCLAYYAPRRLTLAIPDDADSLPKMLSERATRDGPVAYVCEGHQCLAPITEYAGLEEVLSMTEVRGRRAE